MVFFSGVRGADTPFKNWRVMVVEAVSGQTFFKKPPAISTLRISVSVVAWFQPGCMANRSISLCRCNSTYPIAAAILPL